MSLEYKLYDILNYHKFVSAETKARKNKFCNTDTIIYKLYICLLLI